MRRILLSVAFMLALSGVAYGQDSEFSGGGSGGSGTVTVEALSGTAGVVPAFASATSLEDSKMTTTTGGTSTGKGVWTLYDDTAVTGVTRLVLRDGAGQGSVGTLEAYADGAATIGRAASNRPYAYFYGLAIGGSVATVGQIRAASADTGGLLVQIGYLDLGSTTHLRWHATNAETADADIGLARSATGILKVTDGSTGQGGIGIADSGTNSVSDALILRHQGGTVDVGFGTGLLFQAENEAGTMHTIAGIDAVWVDDVDATEDSDLKFYTMEAGAKVLVATMNANDPSLASRSLSFNGDGGIEAGSTLTLESASGANIRFGTTGVAQRWVINGTTGHFHPDAGFSNTYDIGTPSAVVREVFARTFTSDSNLVLGAANTDQIVMGSTYFGPTGSSINTLNLGYVGAEFASAYVTTSIQGANSVTLTAATDDPFVEIAVPVGGTVGGYVEYTIVADDATDYQARSGRLPFSVVNKAGAESAVINTVYSAASEAFAESAGASTLAVTFTTDNATGSNNVRIRANAVSSLTETTLAIKCRVIVTSGTATLTFNP